MVQRANHYEAAFEEYLRATRTAYVAVDERRRALLEDNSLKSMDFVVYSAGKTNLLIDVKGRQFPSGNEQTGHKWENWATEEDILSLRHWEELFGPDYRAVLVFAYHILRADLLDEFDAPFRHRDRVYAFYAVWADDYEAVMTTRSPSWETVSLSSQSFRELREPIQNLLEDTDSP